MTDKHPRTVARLIQAYSHPEDGKIVGNTETWLAGNGVEADGGSVAFRLDSGAGMGNSHLSLLVEFEDGTRVWEYIDMTTLIEAWVNTIVDERAAEVEPEPPVLEHTDRMQDLDIAEKEADRG